MARTGAIKVDAEDFRDKIQWMLDQFGDDVENYVAEATWKTAGEAVKRLKKGGAYQGGANYNKGWARKLTRKRLWAEATVYNKTKPGLAHLLEFGHVKTNGGRTRSFPHISPVNDELPQIFADTVWELFTKDL